MTVLACANGSGEPGVCNREVVVTTAQLQSAVWGGVFVLGPVIFIWIMARRHRDPKIEGPGLPATAHVLWVKPTSEQTFGRQSSGWAVCRIGLRVEVPGSRPYDAKTIHHVSPMEWPRVQIGAIIPVRVDATNPQKVRVNF